MTIIFNIWNFDDLDAMNDALAVVMFLRHGLVGPKATETALANAFPDAGVLNESGLETVKGKSKMRSVALGGPKVRKSRSNFTDPIDGGNVRLYRDCYSALVLNEKRRLKAVLDMLDIFVGMVFHLLSAWSKEINFSPMVWWVLWYLATLSSDPVGHLGLFKVHITDIVAGLGEFLHQVVVGSRDAARRDAAIRGWRHWIREEPCSRPYKWLRPDLVPPSTFLSCDPAITAGGSGIWTIPCD